MHTSASTIVRTARRYLAVASCLVILPVFSAAAGGRDPAAIDPTETATDRIIVKYRNSATTLAPNARFARPDAQQMRGIEEAANSVAGTRVTPLRRTGLGAHVLKLERAMAMTDVRRIVERIKQNDPNVEYAEPDRILKPLFTPNDTNYGSQWHYFEATAGINLPAAWDKATGQGVVVAVIDTGYRPHADLAANIVSGYDMIIDTAVGVDGNGRDSDAQDPGDWYTNSACGPAPTPPSADSSWHGTHVAGTIAAVTNNGSGVAGVAFNAKVQPIRALGRCGGYTSDIADGIIWASGGSVAGLPANATPARVINMSLGGGGACDTTSQSAINAARSRGTVVVVAAGNSNQNAANFSPASCSGVISVAAVNRSGGKAYYSNFGTSVAIAAPGGDVRSSAANGVLSTLNAGATSPGADNYEYYQGTSMASPHVAGVVALMLSKNAALTPDEVKTRLQQTARAFPATCSQCGSGIVNASAAVDAAGGSTPPTGGTVNEVEPNDSTGAAQAIATSGSTVNGTMGSTGDNDYFRVSLPSNATLTATLTPNGASDYDLYLYNSAGTLVARSERGTGAIDTASIRNGGAAAATYYARVRYYSGSTGSSGTYTVKLSW
jgi:serine protease